MPPASQSAFTSMKIRSKALASRTTSVSDNVKYGQTPSTRCRYRAPSEVFVIRPEFLI